MIERYQHPAVQVYFDRDRRMNVWARIEFAWVQARASLSGDITEDQLRRIAETPIPSAAEVDQREATTGHDVVAFLELWTEQMDDDVAHLIHQGLTSSDIVDVSHYMGLGGAAAAVMDLTGELAAALSEVGESASPRLGRTHGQWAEPTSFEHQVQTWMWPFTHAMEQIGGICTLMGMVKTPGATGRGWFFSEDEIALATRLLACNSISISTQILPRVYQVMWASSLLNVALLCESIAMEIRLSGRSEIQEIVEGGVRVGSSAMPGKRNPIGSENISGLARLARGYHGMIAENATFHNDRDISNSSVERVACEDLAHTVATMVSRLTGIVQNMKVDTDRMQSNLREAGHRAMASTYQVLLQRHFRLRSTVASGVVTVWYRAFPERTPDALPTLLHSAALKAGQTAPTEDQASAFTADLMLFEAQMGL